MKKPDKNIDERERALQQKIEAGEHPGDADEKAYWLVFRALNKEVEIPLSDAFAERVSFLVAEKKTVRKKSVFDVVFFGIGFVLLMAAFVVSIVMTEFTFDWGFLIGLNDYVGIFFMGVVLVLVFNIIDVRIIRKQQNSF
jgi:hypothetical protein